MADRASSARFLFWHAPSETEDILTFKKYLHSFI